MAEKNKIPKVYLRTKKIALNSNYGATVSVWIPDTPHSLRKPKIVVTLAHKDNKCSFVFDNEYDMCDAFNEIGIFLEEQRGMIGDALKRAMEDMHDYRTWRQMRKSRRNMGVVSEDGKTVKSLNTLNTR